MMRLVRLSYSGSPWIGSLVFFLAVLSVLALGGFLAIAGAGVQVDFLRFRVDLVVDQNVIDLSGEDDAETPRHQAIALADIDNDSNVDLITIDNDAEAVTIRLGQGDATFGDPSSIPAQEVDEATFAPIGIVVEDFTSLFSDGGGPDGNLDIATIGGDGEVYIAIGDGNGGFAVPDQEVDESFELLFPTGAVSGDFDGDDAPDLAVADGDQIVVFCNSGGTLELCPGGVLDLAEQSADFPVIFDIVSGDFNGDGNGDIAALSPEEGAVYVAFGDGNGSFRFDIPIFLPETKTTGGLAAGRMNGDEIDDIVVSMAGDFGDNSQVSLGSRAGVFTGFPWEAPMTTTVIAVEPFDRDELADVVFSFDNGLAVEPGNGTGDFSGTLGAQNANAVGLDGRRMVNAFTLKAADLNNDSLIDLVGLVSGGTEIEVAINVVDQPTETPTNVPSGTPATPTPSVTGTPPTSTPLPTATPTVTPTAVPTAKLGRCDLRVVEAGKGSLFGVVVGDLDGETGFDIAVSGIAVADPVDDQPPPPPLGMVYILNNTFQDGGDLQACAADYAGEGFPTPLPVSDLQMVAVPDARDLALIDVDDDPEMEIAVIGSRTGEPGVYILDRNDEGRWGLVRFEKVDGAPVRMVADYASDALDQRSRGALDFDGDGETDILVANANRVPTILFGTASVSFEPMLVGNGALSVAVTAGDFNDDGLIDFAFASADNNEIRFLVQGSTARTFFPGGNVSTTGRVVDMESGFFNEDSIPDIFYAGPVAGAFTTSFLLTTNSGNLSQSSSRPYFLIGDSPPKVVAALLFDPPEARLDGIVVQPKARELTIGLGDGAGAVSESLAPLQTGESPQDLAYGDIDGDRQRDLVTANEDGTITILLSSAPPPAPTALPTASPTDTGTVTETPTASPESTATTGPSSTATATMNTPTRTNTKAGIFELSESGCAVDPPAATDLPIGLVAGLVLLLAARFRGVGSGTFESAGRKR